jgi:hypothetical protein
LGSRIGSQNGWHNASIAVILCWGWYCNIRDNKSTASTGAFVKIYYHGN